MVFCRGCGAQIHESAPTCPKCGAPQDLSPSNGDDRRPRTFGNSIAICFNRYFQFRGRAPRAEYWYFVLFTTLVGAGAGFADRIWFGPRTELLGTLVNLALLIPSLAVWTRRMHDLDRTGWWWLLWLVPVIGWLTLLVWACMPGTRGPNRYGPDPLGHSAIWAAPAAMGR